MGYTFPHRRSGTGRTPAHFGRRGQACWQPSPIIRGGSPAFIVLTSITSAPRKRAPESRRALGHLLGNGVRFGTATDVPLAGEGIKTVLSLKSVLPAMPVIAALSADHLAALDSPPSLVRLYIAGDREAAGRMAAKRLHAWGSAAGIDCPRSRAGMERVQRGPAGVWPPKSFGHI